LKPLLTGKVTKEEEREQLRGLGIDPDSIYLTDEQLSHLDDLKKAIWRMDKERLQERYPGIKSWKKVALLEVLPPRLWHEIEISALQDSCSVIFVKSLDEGFGLAATGAGLHGVARIISAVGGLVKQIINQTIRPENKGTGFLVGLDENGRFDRDISIEESAEILYILMKNDRLREAVAQRAEEHVKKEFLLDRYLRDWLEVWIGLYQQPDTSPAQEPQKSSSAGRVMPEIEQKIIPQILSSA